MDPVRREGGEFVLPAPDVGDLRKARLNFAVIRVFYATDRQRGTFPSLTFTSTRTRTGGSRWGRSMSASRANTASLGVIHGYNVSFVSPIHKPIPAQPRIRARSSAPHPPA